MRKRVLFLIFLAITIVSSWSKPVLSSTYASEERAKISFVFGSYKLEYYDKKLAEPDFTVTADFHARRINAPLEDKIQCVEENISKGSTAKSAMLYSFPLLKNAVDEVMKSVNCAPKDAKIEFKPYAKPMFAITREKVGYEVQEERLYYDTFLALRKDASVTVAVPARAVEPKIKANELKECTRLRSSFSTDYSRSSENRKHNIRLALSKINGTVIMPGEEFSFNAKVGKRTEANGYQQAKIIVGGEYTDGVGGGVCQASTTLYNCALLSDLTITAVRPHSLPPSYVPASLDAMVNSSGSDLKFRNDGKLPVFIRAYCTDEKAVVEIYGTKLGFTIKRESVTLSKSAVPEDKIVIDTENKYGTIDLADGESKRVSYGSPAVISEAYLCYYDGSYLIEKKRIRHDSYRSVAGVIAVKPDGKTSVN